MLNVKTLKFESESEAAILSHTKTATWRLGDEKSIATGDFVLFLNGARIFGKAWITEVCEKPFGELAEEDFEGHESYSSRRAMYRRFAKMYDRPVNGQTVVKIIRFELVS